jgi:nickel/cobalt transporter (NicO) family protein
MPLLDFLPAIITGLTVAALHASLPTHWLPFVLASRTQKWSYRKTFSILMIAGIGHVLTTTLIGALVVWFGVKISENFEQTLVFVSAASVFAFGAYNILQHFRGHKHSHCDSTNPHHHDFNKTASDGWAILSLLALLTFSPCESFLPVYISAWHLGWAGFGVLSLVLGLGTLFAMTVFMTIVYFGYAKLKLHWLENYEKLIFGIMLLLLSLAVYATEIIFPHSHG